MRITRHEAKLPRESMPLPPAGSRNRQEAIVLWCPRCRRKAALECPFQQSVMDRFKDHEALPHSSGDGDDAAKTREPHHKGCSCPPEQVTGTWDLKTRPEGQAGQTRPSARTRAHGFSPTDKPQESGVTRPGALPEEPRTHRTKKGGCPGGGEGRGSLGGAFGEEGEAGTRAHAAARPVGTSHQ